MKEILKNILLMLGITYIAVSLLGTLVPRDTTDPVDGRSGLIIYTDNLTGCEYLGLSLKGLTPRMTKEGIQICK